MKFIGQLTQKKKFIYAVVCCVCFVALVSLTAYIIVKIATRQPPMITSVTAQSLTALIKQSISNNTLHIIATPEVVAEVNHILKTPAARKDMRTTLNRLNHNKSIILQSLRNKGLPIDLIVIPIVESRYQLSTTKKNSPKAVGIWQMTPSTAHKYGLIVTGKRDDRLNIKLETDAALRYLNDLHNEFHDWGVVIVAYNGGNGTAKQLIEKVGSHDPWTLVRSSSAPPELKKYITWVYTAIILMYNPALVRK